jgi:hypothetical protein
MLDVRAQGILCITEEVFSDLSLTKLPHVSFISVYAAARLFQFDDLYGLTCTRFLPVISPDQIAK